MRCFFFSFFSKREMSDGVRATVTVLRRGQNTGFSCNVDLDGSVRDLNRTLLEALELPPDTPCTLTDVTSGRVLAADDMVRELSPPCTQLVLDVDRDQDIFLQESIPAKCLLCCSFCSHVAFFHVHAPQTSLNKIQMKKKQRKEAPKQQRRQRQRGNLLQTLQKCLQQQWVQRA